MSEPKFTPGPWSVIKGRHFYEDRFGVEIKGDDFSIQPQMGMTEANAHLIAAAPELYEALGLCLLMLERADLSTGYCCCGSPMDGHSIHDGHAPVDEGDYHHGKVMEHAQAALAKARGENHV